MTATETMRATQSADTHTSQKPVAETRSRAAQKDSADQQSKEARYYTIFATTLMVALITFGILGQLGVFRV